MGPFVTLSVLVCQLFFFVSLLNLKGINGGWLNAHATFYGANQSPATLGKSKVFRKQELKIVM